MQAGTGKRRRWQWSGVALLALLGLMWPLAAHAQYSLYTWGDDQLTPVQVVGPGGVGFLTDVVVIADGLALKSDGTVWTLAGSNNTPEQILGPGGVGFLTEVVAIATGVNLALKSDGTLWAWGDNSAGQLGDGTTNNSNTPVQVLGPGGVGFLTDVVAIEAGDFHSLALKTDGTLWAWGANEYGQLGDGTSGGSENNRSTPVQVKGPGGVGFLTEVVAIAGGQYHSLAVKSDGTVWAWGYDGPSDSNTPVQIQGPDGVGFLTDVVAVAAGVFHSLAVKSDGTLWAWGFNDAGTLGIGTFGGASSTPVQVVGPGGQGLLSGVVAVAGGFEYSLAVKSDGTVWAWGSNSHGKLGDGTTNLRSTPVQVVGPGGQGLLTDVVASAAGWEHSQALVSEGVGDVATVSGVVTLEGCLDPTHPLTFTLRYRDPGRAPLTRTATLGADGAFSLTDIPPSRYILHVQGSKWLAKNLTVDATQGNVSGLSLTLSPGDINQDNTVGILDLSLLADAFLTTPSEAAWNANADLNCDDSVDIQDLSLLADNFFKDGDP